MVPQEPGPSRAASREKLRMTDKNPILTTASGAPVPDNQNSIRAGRC
jgi:catalase